MTIVQTLKTESLRLRKERNPVAASITFVLSEIEKVGKNAGNRETTEDEAIKVVQKIVTTLNDNLQYNLTETDEAAIRLQINILSASLPQMISVEQTRSAMQDLAFDPAFIFNKGNVMKTMRARFGALVDMKLVGQMFEEVSQ